MSKEEAIKELKLYKENAWGGFAEALEIAIESMEKLIRLEEWMDDMK